MSRFDVFIVFTKQEFHFSQADYITTIASCVEKSTTIDIVGTVIYILGRMSFLH